MSTLWNPPEDWRTRPLFSKETLDAIAKLDPAEIRQHLDEKKKNCTHSERYAGRCLVCDHTIPLGNVDHTFHKPIYEWPLPKIDGIVIVYRE